MGERKNSVACIVSPYAADADLAVRFLQREAIEARAYANLRQLGAVLDESAGCLVLVEEALVASDIAALREAIAALPAWCDLPLILVARNVAALASATATVFPESGNVALLERPLNPHTLVSAVQVALRASGRQRQVGELIAQREQAVKLREEFIAMLAHELRNPLAPMRNALYIMRTRQLEDPVVLKSTEILDRQVNHVARLVDDLMDVARLERGKVNLQKQRIDLNRVVAAAVESCLQMVQDRGHHIAVHFGAEALPVDADSVRIEQIVCNLVHNASKFTAEPGRIRVETSVQGSMAVIAVEDQGIGFDPQTAEELFSPFLQANPTLERSPGGLGIGLTIVRRLVELHGGSVHAESPGPGKGSRFAVQIPRAAPIAAEISRAEPATGKSQPRRVVVIEDSEDIRETLGTILAMWGHQVSMADDGMAGIDCIRAQRPDVALIDIGLPGMNGYDVARAVRRDMPEQRIRLVAITGYGQPADRARAMQAGFDAHLLKPIAPQMLKELLEQS